MYLEVKFNFRKISLNKFLIRGHFDKNVHLVLPENTKDFQKFIKGKKIPTCFSKFLFFNIFKPELD